MQLRLYVTKAIFDISFQFFLHPASAAADYGWIVVYPLCIGTETKRMTHAFPQFNLPPVYRRARKISTFQLRLLFLGDNHPSALKSARTSITLITKGTNTYRLRLKGLPVWNVSLPQRLKRTQRRYFLQFITALV
jgi:hypothetical protein